MKAKEKRISDELRPEYNFDYSKAVRGKYYKRMGKMRVVKDFLPPPAQLVLKEENVKVTIALNKSSIEFFKREAQRYHTSYQKMIRQLIDLYASQHKKSA